MALLEKRAEAPAPLLLGYARNILLGIPRRQGFGKAGTEVTAYMVYLNSEGALSYKSEKSGRRMVDIHDDDLTPFREKAGADLNDARTCAEQRLIVKYPKLRFVYSFAINRNGQHIPACDQCKKCLEYRGIIDLARDRRRDALRPVIVKPAVRKVAARQSVVVISQSKPTAAQAGIWALHYGDSPVKTATVSAPAKAPAKSASASVPAKRG